MSGTLGSLVVNLSANIADFQRGMERASQQTEQTMQRMNAAADKVKNMMGAIGGALAVGAIVSEVNKTISALADLDDMAQKTGASVENLSKLGKVAMATGVDFGSVDGAIVKLAKNLNEVDQKGNATAKALAAIGISTADIKAQDPSQVFVQIAQKLQGYEDGAGKVAVATALMGKSAADLLPYMNDVSESIDEFTGYSKEAAAQATKFQDDLGRMSVKYEELKVAILRDALPAMTAFMTAVTDTKRETGLLAKDNSMLTWADDTAILLSRVVDRAQLVSGALDVVGSNIRAVANEAAVISTLNPVMMAYNAAEGKDPMAEYQKAAAESDKAWAQASRKIDAFLKLSATSTEEATIRSIFLRKKEAANMAGLAKLGGMVGLKDIELGKINYNSGGGGGGGGNDKKGEPKIPEVQFNPLSRLSEGTIDPAAADRMMKFAMDETLAMRGTIDVTNDLIEADTRRFEQKMRAAEQITAGAENIRMSLMTDLEHEQFSYNTRMEQLRIFSETKMGNEIAANAWMEQETARHKAAIAAMDQLEADRKMQLQMQVMQQAGGVADQMYTMLQKAGLEQSALGKAAFLTSKGLAVAQIIMSTNAAAANAIAPIAMGGLGPVAGMGLAATIKALGYSSAAMTAGLAIAEASAEGGYDIPAGVNPVTQLHEKEMVLPKAQAEVIRNLATNGGGRGGGAVTLNYSPQIQIDGSTDMEKNRKMIDMAVQQGNADLVDRLQRAGRI